MRHYFGYVLFPGGTVSFFLTMIALATANWVNSGTVKEYSSGLWQECLDYGCSTLTTVPPYLQAVRAFHLTGTAFLLISAILSLVLAASSKSRPAVDACLVLCYVTSSLCLATSLVVYTIEHPVPYPSRFGYSFVVGWLAFALSFLCAVMAIFGALKSR